MCPRTRAGGRAQSRHPLRQVDTDANPDLASSFEAAAIPRLMIVRDGRAVDSGSGALPEPLPGSRGAGAGA
jgi:thioredoxin-like negative regulator of GroEL